MTSTYKHSSKLAGVVVLAFAALSVGSSKPKASASSGKATTSTTSNGDPSKAATLIGSCDRSKDHDSCSESYAPSTAAEEKGRCDFLGGKWRPATACPRMRAVTQCFEGYAPTLAADYRYEGSTSLPTAAECPRGFRDLRKDPDLKPKAAASCHAIATAGTCSQLSSLDEKSEKSCLDSGGELKQPPVPCPTTNVLATMRLKSADGSTETETFYSTPWAGPSGATNTWKKGEVMALCALAGKDCDMLPEGGAAPAPPTTVASKAAPKAKSSAKKKK
jgi:hypothetical protein